MEKENMDEVTNLISRRGIIIPSFEIYGELAGFYDYGPIGFRIKNKIKQFWRDYFIKSLGNLEVETTIVGYEKVYQASGHIKTFTDPILKCTKCGSTYRADKLLEEIFEKEKKLDLAKSVGHMNITELQRLINEYTVVCPKCKGTFSDITPFNLMMKTDIGPTGGITGYLRPETAQGIFVDFPEIYKTYNFKLPIGIGQEGKVFRNEISPRQMLIRMREFSQMELEYFFNPKNLDKLVINNIEIDETIFDKKLNMLTCEDQEKGAEASKISIADAIKNNIIPNKLFAYLLYKESIFLEKLGVDSQIIRYRQLEPDELPHYSKGNIDLEIIINGKYEEVAGNAYRTDFDLKSHSNLSGKEISVLDNNEKITPHVIEVSFGLDRLFWSIITNSIYKDEKRSWGITILSDIIQPYKYSVYPLQKDEKLIKKAIEIYNHLNGEGFEVLYNSSGSIGKRYAKSDEMGIGKSITIDYQTLEDETVTVRDIMDGIQERVKIDEITK